MVDLWLSVRDCGSPAYVIAMLLNIAFLAAVASAVVVFGSEQRQLGIALSAIPFFLGLCIIAVGEYGQFSGRARTDDALRSMSLSTAVDVGTREEIRTEGYKEAAQCVSIGLDAGVLPVIFGFVLVPMALLKKKRVVDEK
jgi:ABC-type Na+ efflux pump permease subunit